MWQQLILPLNNTILFYMPYAFCRYSSFSIITALVAVYNGNMPPELLYVSSVISVSSFVIRLLETFGVINQVEESVSIKFCLLTSNGRPFEEYLFCSTQYADPIPENRQIIADRIP